MELFKVPLVSIKTFINLRLKINAHLAFSLQNKI